MNINERIKRIRSEMWFSQEYVAKYLGIHRSSYNQLENGHRKVLAEEVAKLSVLFGVPADTLLNDAEIAEPVAAFARSFGRLDERDQIEIINLIRIKEQLKAQRS